MPEDTARKLADTQHCRRYREMNDLPSKMKTLLPLGATVLAYVLLLGLPVLVRPNSLQIMISASCSTLAVVTMSRFLRTGPIWARVVTMVVILPLLAHVVLILWSALTEGLPPADV